MRKDIVQQLHKAAETTPLVFEWIEVPEIFTAEELHLTPFADIMQLEPGAKYEVPMPALRAVEHKQQFKDAYKRGGWPAVKEYHSSVMAKIKNSKAWN